MARRVVAVIAAVLIALGVVAARQVTAGDSAADVLAEARAFVGAHRSARFTGTIAVRAGGRTITGRLEGEIETLYRSRVLMAWDNGNLMETVAADTVSYARHAPDPTSFATTKFSKDGLYEVDIVSPDHDVAALLGAARNPKTLRRHAEVTTIEADLDAPDLPGNTASTQPERVTLVARVGDNGAIRSAVVTARHSFGTTTATMRYADWGDRTIKVTEPPPSLIDNPGQLIDRVAIAAWDDSPLVMPKVVPPDWELTFAGVIPADETVEGCAQVSLDYEDPADPAAAFLYLYEFPTTCADALTGDGVVPFTAGRYRGFARPVDAHRSVVQITVGRSTVQADSTLPLAELARLLADLVPLDLDA